MDSPDIAGADSVRERFARAARAERPDLALLCLLIGAEADPAVRAEGGKGVDGLVDAAQIELDRLTGLLPYAPSHTPAQWAHALAELLGGRHGFHGTPADYRRLESSLLNEVLRRRRGLPILLSVVWLEVARRAGAPVYGVALPGHFVVGFGDPRGEHVLADPFAGGLPLTGQDVELLVAGTAGTPLSEAMLQPAGPVEIVLRVLNNIRAWAAARPEHTDVQLWAVELSLLLPHHPARLRYERARLLVERGDFTGGARELEEYAGMVATMEPNAATVVRHEARAARSRLN
ncbi:transglutaminase-like domain-containing protein [Streptomyces barkulensis]|uniref:transglutaminase family protein n=1 Tax=Streptomyces barkulensis TaxID=1257026 RepID=UPI001571576F|nr:transglutaminase-like domain-containing protein [Streptomyces barkulensis]